MFVFPIAFGAIARRARRPEGGEQFFEKLRVVDFCGTCRWLGFRGDIKTSTYFLFLRQQKPAVADFYITRLFSRQRR